MKEIYETLVEEYNKGHVSVLATIIKQAGPSPRGIGAKCLLTMDGTLIGTIGGGRLEGEVLDTARRALESAIPERLLFHLKGKDVEGTDMLCGGDVEVFLAPISPEEPILLSLFQEVLNIHKCGGEGLMATVVSPEIWQSGKTPIVFIKTDGEKIGGTMINPDLERELRDRAGELVKLRLPRILTLSEGEKTFDVFVEPVISDPILFIFGGGHVSQQIVPLAVRIGFKVKVIDDRKEFADPNLFPGAEEVLERRFEGVMKGLPVDNSSYLVIVTRGHSYDKEILAQALKTNARYVGMIGSSRKRNIIYQKLLEEGFTQDDLARVHSPIGLSIGAETPEEIAVSIVAELIQERSGNLG